MTSARPTKLYFLHLCRRNTIANKVPSQPPNKIVVSNTLSETLYPRDMYCCLS